MISPAQVLDRGRLLLGLMLVAPLAALAPIGARSTDGAPAARAATGPGWTATSEPNPIKAITDPADVVAALTNKTIAGVQVVVGGLNRQQTLAAAKATSAAGEVGSDGADPGAKPAKDSDPSPATPPGPLPVAEPSIARYPTPPGTQFTFPVVGGASFTNDWGGERPGGKTHRGIDLFAASMAPVVAEIDGVVFNVGWNDVGGWRYWLRDQWGNEYYHAHLAAFAPAATEGAQVTAGTVLGFVGNSGDATTTPPHIHYEIHPVGGAPIPPFDYVKGWQRIG